MKKITYSILCSLFSLLAAAQSKEVATVQPSVLIVPFTTSGQDALALYESKFEYRAIISEITNAINKKGFTPQDLQEVIAKVKENEAVGALKDVESDPVQKIINNTSADIVIKAEIFILSENGTNSVQLTMKAIDKATGKALFASPLLSSPAFKTNDFAYIAQRILNQDDAIGAFLNGLTAEFQKIAVNGRSIQVRIQQNDKTTYNLDDETSKGDNLADLIIDWFKANAYKNYYKIKSQTAKELYFEEVRIPFKDGNGNNYDINLFAREVRKALANICSQKNGIKPKVETPIVAGGVIRIILP